MLSQNVARSTVPSYYMIRTNLPHRKPQNQWEGVYYFSGITRRQQHLILLQRKRERAAQVRAFNASCAALTARYDLVSRGYDMPPASPLIASAPAAAAAEGRSNPASHLPYERYALAYQLAQHGLYREASVLVEGMHAAKELHMSQYIALIAALGADGMHTRVLHTRAMGDPTLTYKLMGDEDGEERASEAYRWYDMAMAQLELHSVRRACADRSRTPPHMSASSSATHAALTALSHVPAGVEERANAGALVPVIAGAGAGVATSAAPHYRTAAATQLTNALMRTLLTCGYTHVRAIPDALYDRMGALGMSPTMQTYELVTLALCLQGNMPEAESVVRFLRHRCAGYARTTAAENALMLGYREARAFDQCDALWQQLIDSRWPRPNALTAELYLRSIVDHSYTPLSEPMRRFGEVNVVEKKKIPVVLSQMDELGIPRTHLSRPLMDEVEDALRKFSIYKSRFYEWGRAVKQFDFIEFRRRHGWLYDLHLMKNTTKSTPPMRDMNQPDSTLASVATMELPAFFHERQPWECEPLEEMRMVTRERERNEDVRAGDIYYDDTQSIHARRATWMNEVPQTRYDQLYGVNHPDVAKIGIRRHLDVEYVNRTEVLAHDAAMMRRTLSSGRRLRHRVEMARTHRNEGSAAQTLKNV